MTAIKFEKEILNISRRGSLSLGNVEFSHFTLFCRGRQTYNARAQLLFPFAVVVFLIISSGASIRGGKISETVAFAFKT